MCFWVCGFLHNCDWTFNWFSFVKLHLQLDEPWSKNKLLHYDMFTIRPSRESAVRQANASEVGHSFLRIL